MHIAEGVLSPSVLVSGGVLAAAGVGMGLRRLDYEELPRVAVLAAAFFVASLIHVPIGPTSVHLVLNGLVGVILGWAAFPALAVALFLQAILFGYGGLSSLGVNIFNMAFPGVICYYLCHRGLKTGSRRSLLAWGFGAGAAAVAISCFLLALSLYMTSGQFLGVIKLTVAAHLPVMAIEGLVTAAVVVFLRRVRPELLSAPLLGSESGGKNACV